MLTNPSEMLENEESPREKYPHVERRKKLPDPVEKEKRANLWSLIKDCITKDINHVCLPVYFNEPLSHLQRCFEELEYSRLLDAAYEHGKRGNSLMRILHVAAFAVSGYACTEGRHYKSFNPLLGETYEGDYPDKGIRFICEKVSHHPMTIAFHCEGTAWKIWGDITLRIRFLGRSIQLDPVGMLTLKFDDGETFQWNKVSTTLHNLITGKVYADHHGTMHIRSTGQYSCKLKFKNQNSSDRNSHQVQGPVEDDKGNKVATVVGKWDENMFYVPGDISLSSRGYNPVSDASLLWHRNPPAGCCPNRFNFSAFAITLNELTPRLKEKLAPTDSRLRPDQRLMENGEYEKADSEKMWLERKQRMVMKQKGFVLKPRWFQKDPVTGSFCYVGGYWESREEGNWDGCPNIFS